MRRPLTVVLAVAALVLTACASPADVGDSAGGGGDTKVTVGVLPILDVAPIYLGEQKGFFKQRGIDLTMESAQGGATIVPSVVSGQFQFGFSNITSLLIARDKGLDLKIVANGVASRGEKNKDYGGVVVSADSKIRTAKDLAGKTIAVNTFKNIGDSTIRASVRKAGGDPKAVRFVEMPFPDMPAALKGDRVDAVWVVEPFLSIVKGQGARPVAWNFVDTAPDLTVSAYFASKKLLADQPDLVKRFTEAINESLEYAQEHESEVRQVITTYTKITDDQADSLTLPKWPTEVNRPSVETLADLAAKDGLVAKKPDISTLLP